MKTKVKMTCILKSGVKVEDSMRFEKDLRAYRTIQDLRRGIEDSLGYQEPKAQNFTFGTTTIAISEIAAITFKEN